jgi:toxin ParE1/3/4
VLASIREAVRLLGEQLHSGYKTDEPDVRVKFLIRYLYKIFYRVRRDVVEILHIRHAARRPWKWER